MDHFQILKPDLQNLAESVRKIIGNNLVGFYVAGSLAIGAWNPHMSDIDFFVIIKNELSDNIIDLLADFHEKIENTDFGNKLEGEYITLTDLRQKNFEISIPAVKKGHFYRSTVCELSADNVFSLAQTGRCILGEPIDDLGLEVSEMEYKTDVYKILVEHKKLLDKGETLSFQERFYLLVDVLRSIYALETGELATKNSALEYKKDLLGLDLFTKITTFLKKGSAEFEIPLSKLREIYEYGFSLKKV